VNLPKVLKEAGKLAEETDKKMTGNEEDKLMLGVWFYFLFSDSSTILSSLNSLLASLKQLHYLEPNFLFKSIS